MSSISLENINVNYPVFHDYYKSICRAILHLGSGGKLYNHDVNTKAINALNDISFELKDGDRVALIGRNGAGKSTLLRTIGGFITPDGGALNVAGNITSVFNPNAGMDIERTGYENIFILGRLYGVRRHLMEKYIPDIETFSELGTSLKMPVESYSDGMKLRLGIAIATCVHTDILIMDESLNAGDVHFVASVTERIKKMYDRASITIMTSHSAEVLKKLCTSAIWLDQGRILKIGGIHEILDEYTHSHKH